MIICKDLNSSDTISSIDEWFAKCPPQGKAKHWVDGRSAKETAKHWVHVIPSQFTNLLHRFNLKYQLCSPEYVSKFDNLTGNGRNHDLLLSATNSTGENVVISIESKVDEPFDKSVQDYLDEIAKKKKLGISTNADKRIDALLNALIPNPSIISKPKTKYQLMAAVAGTLSEAQKRNAVSAIFIVQTFTSQKMDSIRHRTNQSDLDYFVEIISDGEYKIIHDGDMLGPFRVPGNKYIPNNVDLWVGKYSISLS